MKTKQNKPITARERRWVLFNNGCIHGIQHSELLVVRSVPHRSVVQDTVAVFTISKTFGFIAALAAVVVLVLLLTGCSVPRPQKGGGATSTISRPGHTNSVTLAQSENPKEPSRQTVQSEQTIEYVLPAGTAVSLGDRRTDVGARGTKDGARLTRTANSHLPAIQPEPPSSIFELPSSPATAILARPVPVRLVAKDRTDTSIGGAQKDTVREWAGKAANMKPVMWAGIAMMTLVAGVLIYFGWWTKAAVAVGVGLSMVVLAQTLPDHGTVILLGGLGVFGLVALLVLYAYYKGQLDKNNNGVPDFLERASTQNK
jgi:hypothetical protein